MLGIWADPGVPESVYLRYTKSRYAVPNKPIEMTEQNVEEESQPSAETDDLESSTVKPLKRRGAAKSNDQEEESFEGKRPEEYSREYYPKNIAGRLICQKCNLIVTRDMEHCDDCQVCVEGIDHHCVFFSKCIAKNNLCYFWGSLGMVLFNFLFVGISVAMTADLKHMP